MKLKLVLPFWWFVSLFGMHEPKSNDLSDPQSYIIVRSPKMIHPINSPTSSEPIIATHHSDTSITIHGTIENQQGQDMAVNINVHELRESDGEDAKQVQITKRTLILSHGATAIITAIIGAGVTIAVKYGDCKK